MKKLILLLATLFSFSAFAQEPVMTQPKDFGWRLILSDAGDLKTITTSDTTVAISIDKLRGASVLWVESDTTGLGTPSDQNATVNIYLYNEANERWGELYSGGTFTIASANINKARTTNSFDTYVVLPDLSQWGYASKAKFAFTIQTNDQLKLRVYLGSQ